MHKLIWFAIFLLLFAVAITLAVWRYRTKQMNGAMTAIGGAAILGAAESAPLYGIKYYERDGERRCKFYNDKDQKYENDTGAAGCELIEKLTAKTEAILSDLAKELSEDDLKRGEAIYRDQPSRSVTGRRGDALSATWSMDEYNDRGFQYHYIKNKSIQRYTETYDMLQMAYNHGWRLPCPMSIGNVWNPAPDGDESRRRVKIISVGGGPGFELLAFKDFCEKNFPGIECEFVSMDMAPTWRPYVEALGFKFQVGDVNTDEAIDHMQTYNIVIFSYVLKHYAPASIVSRIWTIDESKYKLPPGAVAPHGPEAIFVNTRFTQNIFEDEAGADKLYKVHQLAKKHYRNILLTPIRQERLFASVNDW